MGAVKKHIHKFLAGLLCVGLLFSYNPAFGAIDAAYADETNDGGTHLSGASEGQLNSELAAGGVGDFSGTADDRFNEENDVTTIITASTYDSTLQTKCRDSFSATVEQLRAGSVGSTDVSYLWFEITGGTPFPSGDLYDVSWQVFVDDEPSKALTDWVTANATVTDKDNVANYHISLKDMASIKNKLMENNHKYTFVATFEDYVETKAVERVSLYTVSSDTVKFKWDIIPGDTGTDLEGTEIEGMMSQNPRPSLTGGNVPSSNPIKGAMEEEAAKNTVKESGDQNGGNYVVQNVLQIGTKPVSIYDENGLTIPPFYEDGFILRLPLDPDYAHSATNPNGYEEGDWVKVLWSGDETGKIEVIEAPLVPDGKGGLRVEIPYPYSGDANGDGIDDTGWPPLPGYFAIQYNTKKLPGNSGGEDVGYFTITANAVGNGTVEPEGPKLWRVNTGNNTGSALENAMYAFTPMGFGDKANELTELMLTNAQDENEYYDLLNPGELEYVGGELSELKTTLTLNNEQGMFMPGSEWILTAKFELSSPSGEDAKGVHSLTATAKKKDGSDGSEYGKLWVSYYDESHTNTVKPTKDGNIEPDGSVSVNAVLNTSASLIGIVPASPVDEKYYEATGVRMRVDGGEWEVQAYNNKGSFVVPATSKNVEVEVIFEEFSTGSLGGQKTFTATATVAEECAAMGSVIDTQTNQPASEVTVEFNENSVLIPTITFQGVDEAKYLSAVDIFVGDRQACDRVTVNPNMWQTFPLSQLQNYRDNVRIVGYFTDANAPTIHFSIVVKTTGSEDATAGGSYSTLGWTQPETGMVRSLQRCPLLITPNTGYVLASVEETRTVGEETEASTLTSQVKGNVLDYVAIDGRSDTSEDLDITLTITFAEASGGGDTPGDNSDKKLSRVSMYVADKSLNEEGSDLAYLFKPEAGKFFVDGQPGNTSSTGLSVNRASSAFGSINGETAWMDTVSYRNSYPMNLIGNTVEGQRYGIQKVLVVTYYYETGDDGIQTKKGLSWNVYTTNMPVFVLQNVTANTDVVAYFAPVGDGPGQVPDNGFDDTKDYCTVTATSTPLGMVTPSVPTKVVKGSQLPVEFTVSNAEYTLANATVKMGSSTDNITETLTAAGTSRATYIIEDIVADTTVTATYDQRPEEEIVRHKVSTDVWVKDDGEAEPVGSGTMPCEVAVEYGANYAQKVALKNGVNLGVPLLEGSDMRFALTRDEGRYLLGNLKLVWDDPTVMAYRATVSTTDGAVRNLICFTTDEVEMVGRMPYQSGTDLYSSDFMPEDVNTDKSWYVSNLLCDITLVPEYFKTQYIPMPDTGNYWTLTTKVGTGFGQILVNDANANGCVTKIEKGSVKTDSPLVIKFQPGEGYRISKLHVDTHTDNVLRDFWSAVEGFLSAWTGGGDLETKLQEEAIANKSITLQGMMANYDVTVDFELIPDNEGGDKDKFADDHVAVNVKYDPDKGTVTPNTGLVVNRNAQQQFVAKPKYVTDENGENKKYYKVTGVRVSAGDGIAHEVRAIDKTSDLVKWDEDFANVFVVDFSQLAWPDGQPDAAATVEILFSDEATEPPAGPGDGDGDGDGDDTPDTPTGDNALNVTINVVVDGQDMVGDNGVGGIVSPRGELTLITPKAGATPYKQQVDVMPSSDYRFAGIVVASDNTELNTNWLSLVYMQAVTGNSFFEIEADKPGNMVVTVYFELKPAEERTYSILAEGSVPDANRFIEPHGVVTLENTKSQTFSIDPDLNYQVKSITDTILDENNNDIPLPEGVQGANWTRQEGDTQAINEVTIFPIRVKGVVASRHVVVEFEYKEGVDHGIEKSDLVNLHVQAYGSGKEYVTFDPSHDLLNVFKGTATKKVSYTYNFALSQEGIDAGYGIYRVSGCGENVFGSANNSTDLCYEGSYTFETDKMKSVTNNLNVYVKKNPNAINPNPNPNPNPDEPDPDNPSNKYVTVDYGCGNGGSIVDKNPSARVSRAMGGEGGQMTGSLQIDPELPFELLITPDEGYVIDKIIMDNCYIIEPNWTTPEDGRTAEIALDATMEVLDHSKSARVLATFVKGDPDKFEPWEPTEEDGHTYTIDGSLVVHITPAEGVEALVDMADGNALAANILDVSNPVAPFTPTSTKKLAAASDPLGSRYEVSYDTVSKLGEENNFSIVVGPLIKWNDEDNSKSVLYTLDSVTGLQDGFTVTEKPMPNAMTLTGDEEQPAYYTYYEIKGTIDQGAARNVMGAAEDANTEDGVATLADESTKKTSVIRIGLRGLSFDEGLYPDHMTPDPGNNGDGNGGNGGNGGEDGKGNVTLRAQVLAGEGSIAPTATTVGTSWYDGNLTGPWTVAEGSTVSFKVQPAAGYVLSVLSYNSINALANGSYDPDSEVLTFQATTSTTVFARFAQEGSKEAMRTVTIEVQGGHGTTSPEPGTHQVEKGQPYAITFKADSGYVPYRIWVDGQESYVSPSLSGWMLPAWWNDQTFKVEYALAGTTPSGLNYLVQTGQNVADQVGTALVKTGDNPWLPMIVLLLLVAGGAAFVGTRMMHASEAAGRAAKYSVTRRSVPRDKDDEE